MTKTATAIKAAEAILALPEISVYGDRSAVAAIILQTEKADEAAEAILALPEISVYGIRSEVAGAVRAAILRAKGI